MSESLIKLLGAVIVGAPILLVAFWQLLKYLIAKVAENNEKRLLAIEEGQVQLRKDLASLNEEWRKDINTLDREIRLLRDEIPSIRALERGHGRIEATVNEMRNNLGEVEKDILQRLDVLAQRTITRDEFANFRHIMEDLSKSLRTHSDRIDGLYRNNK